MCKYVWLAIYVGLSLVHTHVLLLHMCYLNKGQVCHVREVMDVQLMSILVLWGWGGGTISQTSFTPSF